MNKFEFDKTLFLIVIFMLLFGMVMIYSASAFMAYRNLGKYPHFFAVKHLIFSITGIIVMYFINSIEIENLKKYTGAILISTFIMLILVFIPHIGYKANGANRWINLRFMNLQPSEYVKLSLILFLAKYISERRSDMSTFKIGFFPPMAVISIFLALIVVEPNFTTAMIIGMMCTIILFIGGARITHILTIGLIIGIIGSAIVIHSPYKMRRVKSWMGIEIDALNKDYHTIRSKLAVCTGGLLGKGLSNSEVKIAGLPEAHTDFIFAIMCEELGYIMVMTFIVFYIFLIYRCYLISSRASTLYQKFIGIGITVLFSTHIVINIAVVINVLPPTGITLPFISYGGSSLIMFMICIGLMMNISSKIKRELNVRNVRTV